MDYTFGGEKGTLEMTLLPPRTTESEHEASVGKRSKTPVRLSCRGPDAGSVSGPNYRSVNVDV